MAQPIIEICHVTKIYTLFKNNKEQFLSIFYRSPKLKKHLALDDVTFSVEKGESVGIIGNNGAGKSTILKTITGVTFPTSGQVEYLELPSDDTAVVYRSDAGTALENIVDTIAGAAKSVVEYFR